MKLKRLALLTAAALALNFSWGATPLPFFSPCDDLTGFTTFGDSGYSNEWGITTFGAGNNANPAFSYVPGYRQNNYNWNADGIVFTPELSIESGKAYKVSVVMGAWYTSTASQPYVSQEIAAYASPVKNAAKTLIGAQSAGEAYNSTKRPSYTYYFKGEAGKPYIGFKNTGAGNITRFSIDDINIVEVDVLTPDIVTGLSGNIDGKNVTLTFTLPTATVTGDPLQNIQSVRILRDGRLIKEYTDQNPGAAITFTDVVSAVGDATYTVECGNNGSYGEAVAIVANVTDGTVAPTQNTDYSIDPDKVAGYFGRNYNAYAQYVPGEGVKISWALPLSSFNESAIPDGEDKTVATVTRLSDSKVIVTDCALGEVTDTEIDPDSRALHQYKVDLKRYTFTKTANSSVVSLNNPVPFMPAVSSTTLNEFTVIDADGDNTTWSVMTNGDAKYHEVTKWFSGSNSTKSTGDDWLITPGIILEKGKTYRFDADMLCTNLIETPIQFEIRAGSSNTIEALTEEVIPMTKFKALTPQTYSAFYTPEETGNVFFGIRTKDSAGGLGVSRLFIDEVSSDLPTAIELINVTYSPTTPGEATVSFEAPTNNIKGEPLTALEKIELYCNDELIETYQNPTPGETYSKDISFRVGSQDVYKTIPYTAAGAGLATTASVMVLEPPYSNTFDSEGDVTGFTVIDIHESGYTWNYMAINKAMRSYPDRSEGQDDYLITPPIHLEKDMFYKIDFRTWLAAADYEEYYDNQLEVLLGTAPTKEALTTTVHEPFYVRGGFDSKALVKEWFTVPETGEYYLAWHSIAEPYLGQEIYIDDVNISAKIPGTYPGPVTDLVITPDQKGGISANLKFKIPVNDLLGNPMSDNVTKTEIYRDGEIISTQLNKKPGTEIEITDQNGLTEGVHLYTITNFGYDSSAREYVPTRDVDEVVYVGLNRPGRVGFVEAVENPDNYGEVTITWSKPETDINGFPLNTTDLTYTIGRYILDNVTGAQSEVIFEQNYVPVNEDYSFTHQVKKSGEKQEFMRFFVRANTKPHTSSVHSGACSAGSGSPTVITVWHAIGQPFPLPYSDSFKNSNSEHGMLGQSFEGFAGWGYNTKNPVTGVEPVDDDKGLCMMESEFAESGARLFTTRIELNKEHPYVSLYLYNQKSSGTTDDNIFSISVREGSGEFTTVAGKTVDEWCDGVAGWQKVTIDLSDYAGKVIYLGLEGMAINMRFIHLDKIIVDELPEVDVAAKSLTNTRAYTGLEHTVSATVKNNGSATLPSATVNLKLDGELVGSVEVTDIPAGEMRVATFTNLMTREDLGIHKYTAEVVAEGDADLLDNYMEGDEFSLDDNNFPTVMNLEATQTDGIVSLSWQKPMIPSEPQHITDDFENYASWSTIYSGIGDYTLVDNDRLTIGGFEDDSMLPGIPYGSKQSFTLWDFSKSEISKFDNYYPYSGDKCLVSIYTISSGMLGTTDDWLISPQLPGMAQSISFYAKAYSDQYPENFTVLYSKNGTDWDDFKDNQFDQETVGGTYTKFTYKLPQGAKYFMIRHYSRGGYFLFIDDLTYTPVGDETLELAGYNVYRDGERMTESVLTSPLWSDSDVEAQNDYVYGVTAVYDRGESPAEEVSIMVTTGISDVLDAVTVTSENGEIVISGAEGLDFFIADTAGLMITARTAEEVTRVPVNAGVYVVNVSGKAFKIIVR